MVGRTAQADPVNTVTAERQMTPNEANAMKGTSPEHHEPNVASPARIETADGEPIAIVMRATEDLMTGLRQAMRKYPMSTTLRSSGLRNVSAVFGYAARNQVLRREGCRMCGGATAAPAAHAMILGAAVSLSAMFHGEHPFRSADDREQAARIRPEWRMGGTQWTSGVLNETSALPYHTDANNMPTWNAMIVARRGTRGGHFHVPEYGLTMPCRDGDVIFMPAYRLVHGVTPITKVDEDGYRYSAVFYTVSRMKDCQEPDAELAQGQRARSEREDTLLERQRESGLLTD